MENDVSTIVARVTTHWHLEFIGQKLGGGGCTYIEMPGFSYVSLHAETYASNKYWRRLRA